MTSNTTGKFLIKITGQQAKEKRHLRHALMCIERAAGEDALDQIYQLIADRFVRGGWQLKITNAAEPCQTCDGLAVYIASDKIKRCANCDTPRPSRGESLHGQH